MKDIVEGGAAALELYSMIPKRGYRFSEKIMLHA
jgi:hypothetical protein